MWSKGQTFFYEWNIEHNASPNTHPRSRVSGQKVKTFFSEVKSSDVAYQIKGNRAWSTMQALILSSYTPSTHRVGSKGQNIFLNVAMLHIKLKGKKSRPTNKQKLWPYTHTWPLGWVKRSDIEIYIFIELSAKTVDRLLIMISMIPKVNFGVGGMGFMFVINTFHFNNLRRRIYIWWIYLVWLRFCQATQSIFGILVIFFYMRRFFF